MRISNRTLGWAIFVTTAALLAVMMLLPPGLCRDPVAGIHPICSTGDRLAGLAFVVLLLVFCALLAVGVLRVVLRVLRGI